MEKLYLILQLKINIQKLSAILQKKMKYLKNLNKWMIINVNQKKPNYKKANMIW